MRSVRRPGGAYPRIQRRESSEPPGQETRPNLALAVAILAVLATAFYGATPAGAAETLLNGRRELSRKRNLLLRPHREWFRASSMTIYSIPGGGPFGGPPSGGGP